jgi:hypothetical protein
MNLLLSKLSPAAFLIVFMISTQVSAQHTIQLLNGKQITAETYSVGDIFVSYKKVGDTRTAPRLIDRFDVFSVKNASGEEEMLYAPSDSLDFSVADARLYIEGEQTAIKYYNRPSVKWTSAVVGAGSSILSFYALPIPMLYSLALGRHNPHNLQMGPRSESNTTLTPELSAKKDNEAFRFGYQRAARNIKIQQSLKWGYISLGVGIAALIIATQ